MPTAYTQGIINGEITTFQQFATQCMRAFGATIHMRGNDLSAKYEPRQPEEYHQKEMNSIKGRIKVLKKQTDKSLIYVEKKGLESSKKHHVNSIKRIKEQKSLLDKIMIDVRKWTPPTSEHKELKKFMDDQIRQTIEFDCNTEYHENALIKIESDLLNINAKEIRQREIDKCKKDMEYHFRHYQKEVEGCERSNKWVQDLLTSLKK